MKLIKLILLTLTLFSNIAIANYGYNIYPNSSGIIKYKAYDRTDNSVVLSKEISENNKITISLGSTANGDISLKANIDSQYALKQPTLALFDSNWNIISYKKFSDNSTNIEWIVSNDYLADGVHNYNILYFTNNDKYNFAFFFKTIQISKSFIEPVIRNILSGSSTDQNNNEGYVGDTFTFVASISETLPSGYYMDISFEGVNSDGSNSGYYGAPYRMSKKDDKIYYYKKVIQKAGNNRHYKVMIKKSDGTIVDYRIGSYIVHEKPITDPIQINNYSIVKDSETNEYEKFKMTFSMSQIPIVVKIETENGNTHYFLKQGVVQQKPDFVETFEYSSDKKSWTVYFKIYKEDYIQNKSFKLIVQDYRAKDAAELVATQTKYFSVEKKTVDISEENLQKIISFLNQSSTVQHLNLSDEEIRQTHLSRAEAAVIVDEFLKLKNPNFKLPYEDASLYDNPFVDIDKNSNYYEAVIKLANYKGSDNTTVLTKTFGIFHPLKNVTRFEFVKMIVEGLNLLKTTDFSNIQSFSDYNQLDNEAKIYFATSARYGLIKGENNRLLPYDKLTIFQALTVLQRAQDMSFNVDDGQFEEPKFNNTIDNPLGMIPEEQFYDPTVTPIDITDITMTNSGKCKKLSVIANIDSKVSAAYIWSANFGYFQSLSNNNKEVLFCPSSKKPTVDYKIVVTGWDNYMNADDFHLSVGKDAFAYDTNIADTYSDEIIFNMDLTLKSNSLKEGSAFVINKSGSLFKNKVNIGLEKVAVTLKDADGKIYMVNDVKWDDNSIYFVVPSIKEFYGKNITVKVEYGSNDKHRSKIFNQIMYKPQFVINGDIQPDKYGYYPNFVVINSKQINVVNGKFIYVASNAGAYSISIDNNYQRLNVSLTDTKPTAYVNLSYIDLDYDGDGVENDKDAFPYDPNKWEEDNGSTCKQVTTHAYNPKTGEEKDFSSSCDVPSDWVVGEAPDNDGDGINDIKDSDDDNDGMSDDYETGYGFDPMDASDRDDDADKDGFTNIEEHDAGTDPTDDRFYPRKGSNPSLIMYLLN